MKPVGLLCLIILFFSYSLTAQKKDLTIVSVEDKDFLSLHPESPPENMVWGSYGSEIESFYGVTAYSNGARKKGRKYQCTELVHRFLAHVYGIPTNINMGLGHGKDLAKNLAERFKNTTGTGDSISGFTIRLENFANGKSAYPPVVGSVVSMHFNRNRSGYGHVGIIRSVEKTDDGTLVATLFDQHGFIHKKEGLRMQADTLIFTKNEAGNWSGKVHSWLFNTQYPVVSWTNPVIVKQENF